MIFSPPPGAEHPGPPQVPPQSEQPAGWRRQWQAGRPLATRLVCHRHTPTAASHPGDQDKEHDLQDQTQAGLHPHGLRRQVGPTNKTSTFSSPCVGLVHLNECVCFLPAGVKSSWATPRPSSGSEGQATSSSTPPTCCTVPRTTFGVSPPSWLCG